MRAGSPPVEVATHTITHTTGTGTTKSVWRNEIVGAAEYIEKLAMVPRSEV
jgi:hypothetical protein